MARKKVLQIRLSEREYNLIREYSKKMQLSMAEYIRHWSIVGAEIVKVDEDNKMMFGDNYKSYADRD